VYVYLNTDTFQYQQGTCSEVSLPSQQEGDCFIWETKFLRISWPYKLSLPPFRMASGGLWASVVFSLYPSSSLQW